MHHVGFMTSEYVWLQLNQLYTYLKKGEIIQS